MNELSQNRTLYKGREVTVDVHVMCSAMDIQRSWRFNQRLAVPLCTVIFQLKYQGIKECHSGKEEKQECSREQHVQRLSTGELEHWADPSKVKEQEWGRNNKEQAYRRQGLAPRAVLESSRVWITSQQHQKVTKAEGLTGSGDFHLGKSFWWNARKRTRLKPKESHLETS